MTAAASAPTDFSISAQSSSLVKYRKSIMIHDYYEVCTGNK